MGWALRAALATFGMFVGVAGGALPAAARESPITGKLSKPGFTVIALTPAGKTSTTRTRDGAFRLRPPAGRVTLHLRAPGGLYAGPIVLAGRSGGRRAVVGVRAGARLGAIAVDDARGYARVVRRPGRRATDARRLAKARGGVPIGAGNFGRVRSRPPRRAPRGDRDFDGVPDRLDIDDDGDLVLDKQDRSRRGRAAQATTAEDPLALATGLGVQIEQTPNVHAGSTDEQIEQALQDLGYLLLNIPFGVKAVELDCGAAVPAGLPYCAAGGTGMSGDPPNVPFAAFPSCCDGDGDGFGLMTPTEVVPGEFQNFSIDHRSTTAQIGTGDVLIEHITLEGDERDCPPPAGTSSSCQSLSSVQQYVFTTVPALRSFDDGAGPAVTVAYPVAEDGPGTSGNPLPVAATGGKVVLSVSVWRPQRRPTSPGECVQPPAPGCIATEWIDMGGLVHSVTAGPPGRGHAAECPPDAFSAPGPNLVATSLNPELGGFFDQSRDQAVGPDNAVEFKVNLTRCLESAGLSWGTGSTREVKFQVFTPSGGASAGIDNAAQAVSFRRTR